MNASTDRNDPFLHGGKIEFICFAVAASDEALPLENNK